MDRVRNGRGMFVENPGTVERERRAVEMRARGATYREITQELGVDTASAHRMVSRALARVPAEAVKDLRALELLRLEELWRLLARIIQSAVDKPELQLRTIDRMMAVMERTARLMGLDAPPKRVVEVVTDEVLERLIDEEQRAIQAQRDLLTLLADNEPSEDERCQCSS